MADRKLHILYVEDNHAIAELALMALDREEKISIWHCFSGYDALEAIEVFQPDLCLLDMKLPGIDGLETLRRIRKLPLHHDLPTIFLTAKSQIHEQDEYVREGAVAVIVKPFDPLTLSGRILDIWACVESARKSGQPPQFITLDQIRETDQRALIRRP